MKSEILRFLSYCFKLYEISYQHSKIDQDKLNVPHYRAKFHQSTDTTSYRR